MERCPDHEQIRVDLAVIKERTIAIDTRINGSIDDIKKHIEQGTNWRLGIVGVAFGLIVQVIFFSNLWGKLTQMVEANTDRLAIIESSERQAQVIRTTNVTKIQEIENRINILDKRNDYKAK